MTDTIKLIVAALILGAAAWGLHIVLGWRDAAIRSEHQTQTLEAASGIMKDGTQAAKARGKVASGVAEAKHQFDTQIAEDDRNDPEIAERGGRLVPASRLRAFRERRLARERLGCAASECRTGIATSHPGLR